MIDNPQIVVISIGQENPAILPMVENFAINGLPTASVWGIGRGGVVGVGELPSLGPTPTIGTVESEVAGAVQRGIVPAPNAQTIDLIYTDYPLPTPAAGFHGQFPTPYCLVQPTTDFNRLSIVTGHELTEAAVDPSGAGMEVCDPFTQPDEGYYSNGYWCPWVESPSGQPLCGPNLTVSNALGQLEWLQAASFVTSVWAPSFTPNIDAQIASNPMSNTDIGAAAKEFGLVLLAFALEGQT